MAEAARLLDTSIFIDFLRGNDTAKAWIGDFSTSELAYSVITAAEFLAGCRNRREQDIVEKELALYPMIHISGGKKSIGVHDQGWRVGLFWVTNCGIGCSRPDYSG